MAQVAKMYPVNTVRKEDTTIELGRQVKMLASYARMDNTMIT